MVIVMITAPAKSNKKPARAISLTVIISEPNTMVLGAVATGNIKPSDAANVAGNIKYSGLMPDPTAMAAKMGSTNVTVATLLANSLSTVTSTHTKNIMAHVGSAPKKDISLANQPASPDTPNPSAKANPPPNNSITLNGSFCTVFQSINISLALLRAGIKNNRLAMAIATVPS